MAKEFTPDQEALIQLMIDAAVSKATGKVNLLKSVPEFGEDKEQKDWTDKDTVEAYFTKIAENFSPGTHHVEGAKLIRDWHSIKIMGKKGIVENAKLIKKYEYLDPNAKFLKEKY
jgi:hypothetical protein